MARRNIIKGALAERATCNDHAAMLARAAQDAADKGLDWIAKTYRERADEYTSRSGEISVALRTLNMARAYG